MSRWYKRCGSDFIHGTMSLTLEEKGAYSLCLDLIYDRGGPIPDDARWLSGICGVSMRKWNSLRQSLIDAGKLTTENGLLMNARAGLELVSMEFQRRNQAESGAKGGRKRAENAAALNENKDLVQATLKPIEEIREEKKEDTLAKAKADSDADFWRDAKGFLARSGKGNPGALIQKWLREQGKELTLGAIAAAQLERAVDPVAYVNGYFRRNGRTPILSGYAAGHSGVPL